VAVVCAGAKSVLDLPLTLEYLETQGVPVVGVGQDRFAAFYSRDSGLPCDFRIDAPADQARFVRTKWALGLGGGVVFSNPVPLAHEIPPAEIEAITRQALDEARAQGVSGKAVTPIPAGAHQGADRRAQPGDQHRAGEVTTPRWALTWRWR